MLKLAITLILLFYWILISHSSAEGISDLFEEIIDVKDVQRQIVNEIKKLELSTNVKLFDSQLINGIGLGIQYRYELEPSYEAGFHTRADSWKFNGNLSPDNLFRAMELPLSLRFDAGAEIFYIRQFKQIVSAASAIPYTPARLPVTAAKAIENLKPGDFVSIPTHLNLALRSSMVSMFKSISLEAASHLILSGKFMIHLFRLTDNRIRLKIIATRTESAGVNGDAKFDLQLFGINLWNRSIKKIFKVELGHFSSQKEWGDLFLLDYVIDLNDEKAKQAYNQVLSANLKFKNLEIINPFTQNRKLEDQIISDLTLLEELSQRDLNKDRPSVLRLFRAKNQYRRTTNDFKVGLLIARYQRNNIFTQNRIVSYDKNNNSEQYLFNNYSFLQNSRMFWGLFGRDHIFTLSTLLPLNSDDQVNGFSDLGISLDIRDKRFLYHEIREAINHLRRSLTNELFRQIDFKEFKLVKPWQKVSQARIYHQIFFHEEAIQYYMKRSTQNLKNELESFLQTVPMPGGGYSDQIDDTTIYNWINWLNTYERSVNSFIDGLKKAFEISEGPQIDRFKAFEQQIMKLRNNIVFQTIGTGFMIYVLPADLRQRLVHVNLAWDADGITPVRYQSGLNPKSEMYSHLEYIDSTLNNRGYDLRLIEEQKNQMMKNNKTENFMKLYRELDDRRIIGYEP